MTPNSELSIYVSKDIDFNCNFDIESFVRFILKEKQIEFGSFEFNFIDNPTIQKLNATHLKKDMPTDIIAFNLGTPKSIEGDVYISIEQAKINAQEFNNSFDNELKLLIVHGILHLLGYKDYTEEEKQEMETEQTKLLALNNRQ